MTVHISSVASTVEVRHKPLPSKPPPPTPSIKPPLPAKLKQAKNRFVQRMKRYAYVSFVMIHSNYIYYITKSNISFVLVFMSPFSVLL